MEEGSLWGLLYYSQAPASGTLTFPSHQRLLRCSRGASPTVYSAELPGTWAVGSTSVCVPPDTLGRLVLPTDGLASSIGSPLSEEGKMWYSL